MKIVFAYIRFLTAGILLMALIGSFTYTVFLLLAGLYPGEDHDFDTSKGYLFCALFASLTLICGFILWRRRRWLFPTP